MLCLSAEKPRLVTLMNFRASEIDSSEFFNEFQIFGIVCMAATELAPFFGITVNVIMIETPQEHYQVLKWHQNATPRAMIKYQTTSFALKLASFFLPPH